MTFVWDPLHDIVFSNTCYDQTLPTHALPWKYGFPSVGKKDWRGKRESQMQELHNALRLLAYHLFSLRVYCIELLYTATPSSLNSKLLCTLTGNTRQQDSQTTQLHISIHSQHKAQRFIQCAQFSFSPQPHPSTWKDGLYEVRDYLALTTWANHCSWAIRNSHLLLRKCHFTVPLGGPC